MTALCLFAALLSAALLVIASGPLGSRRLAVLSARGSEPASSRLTRRSRKLRHVDDPLAMAASWDLLAACLRAGLPLAEALRAVSGGMSAEAADAVRRTSELIALGAPAEEAWRPATECAATASLAHAARRSARSGAALAGAASELAARLRAEQADVAEAKAQRTGVLITGPLGLCFLPGFLCLGVVPVVIGLAGQLTVTP